MMTAVMMMSGETGLLELLRCGQRSAGSGSLKRRRELTQLGSLEAVSNVGCVLSGLIKPACDFCEHLAELARILLLHLRQLI
jgi:hypothetical protein